MMNLSSQLIQYYGTSPLLWWLLALGCSSIAAIILHANRETRKAEELLKCSNPQYYSSESGTTQSQRTCSCKGCKLFRKTLKSGRPVFREDTFITTLLGQRPGDILKELSDTRHIPSPSSTRLVTMRFSQLPKKPSSKIKLSTVIKASSKSTGRTSKQSGGKANG